VHIQLEFNLIRQGTLQRFKDPDSIPTTPLYPFATCQITIKGQIFCIKGKSTLMIYYVFLPALCIMPLGAGEAWTTAGWSRELGAPFTDVPPLPQSQSTNTTDSSSYTVLSHSQHQANPSNSSLSLHPPVSQLPSFHSSHMRKILASPTKGHKEFPRWSQLYLNSSWATDLRPRYH
jgi:hypothetical protein